MDELSKKNFTSVKKYLTYLSISYQIKNKIYAWDNINWNENTEKKKTLKINRRYENLKLKEKWFKNRKK